MTARLYVDRPLHAGAGFALPEGPARHVRVLRLQPGDALVLFDGLGGEWDATIARIGARDVAVDVQAQRAVDRELPFAVTLAIGMPANERMDALVEKVTELGVAAIRPLQCERSVLRLAGERALKRQAHWQAIAVAACEQSGRTRVPRIEPIETLRGWLAAVPPKATDEVRFVLSPRSDRRLERPADIASIIALSGPEGGLTDDEEAAAQRAGFVPATLGARVLRADTAPLALLAWLALG
ncbi:MAG: 16S rRNA (uracil(1498)-N(3))-methyltransferase [Proteobacteria bacterium]|nr:16S rRNA (uracil(1498)-N(3))-methyltransferase [Pseudomonadota bacterium]